MGLTMNERKSLINVLAPQYQKAARKEKHLILDQFILVTRYNRSYASFLLSHHGKKSLISPNLSIVADATKSSPRSYKKTYDLKVLNALKKIWFILDCICGKRLAPLLPEIIPVLERHNEIHLDPLTRQKLQNISSATIDRLLRDQKRAFLLSSKSKTKPGTLLKNQIPIRTFADWDDLRPGFVEIDLVAHEGGDPRGEFIQTLDVTDVATGWTETQAVKNKAQIWVFNALKDISTRLPFRLLGIDSDNGGEFINAPLLRYCQAEKITFTRGRAYRKNDNCYVEQKNYSVVRRAVGYYRYESEQELKVLNELYCYLRLYTNYFQPCMKLIEKEKVGSKVKKKYDEARTPYRRVIESEQVSKEEKEEVKKEYEKLNPAQLKREISRLQQELIEIGERKRKSSKEEKERMAEEEKEKEKRVGVSKR